MWEVLRNSATHLPIKGRRRFIFADSNHILGVIAVADVVKPTSAEAISQLKDMHIDVVMLTGDHKENCASHSKNS